MTLTVLEREPHTVSTIVEMKLLTACTVMVLEIELLSPFLLTVVRSRALYASNSGYVGGEDRYGRRSYVYTQAGEEYC